MPIEFSQPGPFDPGISSDYGAAQMMLQIAALRRQQGGGGGGGGGNVGMAPQGRGGGSGGGGGGGGGTPDYGYQADAAANLYRQKLAADQDLRDQQAKIFQQIYGQQQGQQTAQTTPDQGQPSTQVAQALEGDTSEAGPMGDETGDTSEAQPMTSDTDTPLQSPVDPSYLTGAPQPGQQQAQQQQNASLAGAQFTQADRLTLARLQNGQSRVQTDLQAGIITPQMAQAAISMIRTGINPLQMRQQQAQAALIEQNVQAQQHHNAIMTAMRTGDATSVSQLMDRMTFRVGDSSVVLNPMDGRMHIIHDTRPERHADRLDAQQKADNDEDKQFRHDRTNVEKQVDERMTSGSREDKDKEIERRMRALGYHAGDLGTHRSIRNEMRTNRPFTENTPASQRSTAQNEILTGLDRYVHQATQGRPGANLERFHENVREVRGMLQQYGSLRLMPADVRRRFDGLSAEIRGVANPSTTNQPAQPSRRADIYNPPSRAPILGV